MRIALCWADFAILFPREARLARFSRYSRGRSQWRWVHPPQQQRSRRRGGASCAGLPDRRAGVPPPAVQVTRPGGTDSRASNQQPATMSMLIFNIVLTPALAWVAKNSPPPQRLARIGEPARRTARLAPCLQIPLCRRRAATSAWPLRGRKGAGGEAPPAQPSAAAAAQLPRASGRALQQRRPRAGGRF